MNSRRQFLKLGAVFVPAVVAPQVAYSFLCGGSKPVTPRIVVGQIAMLDTSLGKRLGIFTGDSWFVPSNRLLPGRILSITQVGVVVFDR